MSGTGDEQGPPLPPPMPTRRRRREDSGKKPKPKPKPIQNPPSSSSAVFPPLPERQPRPESYNPKTQKNENTTESRASKSGPPKETLSKDDEPQSSDKRPKVTRSQTLGKILTRNKTRIDRMVDNFMQDVVDTINARDRFNERTDIQMEEISICSSDQGSIRIPVDPEQSVLPNEPIDRFRKLVEMNEEYILRKGRQRRFKQRLPERDTSTLHGQIRAKLDILCLKVSDCIEDTGDVIDDARLIIWRKLRDMATGIKQKGGQAVLGKAYSMFGDIMKELDDRRYPITQIPKFVNDSTPDPHAAFRYLEERAAEQGIGMYAQEFEPIEYDESRLQNILDIVDPEERDELGQAIIHLAAQYCNPNTLDWMIDSGYDVNIEDSRGYTPLFYAVMIDNTAAMAVLLKNGAFVNHASGELGRQAIHIAAQFGSLDSMKLLLDHGASIDCADENNHTPIVISAYYSHSEIAAFLLEEGANPCIEDKSGIMGAMRIAYTMPTITREVFNQFVTEDIYQGERYYKLDRMLGSSSDTNTSFYHYLVWLANMGLIEHPMFDRLTAAKWEMYGKARASYKLSFVGLYLFIWSLLYVMRYRDFMRTGFTFKFADAFYLIVLLVSMGAYVWRSRQNLKLLRQRYGYTAFLNDLFEATYQQELKNLHFKGKRMDLFLTRKYGGKQITIFDDVKSSPAVLLDFVVDNLLMIYLILNFSCSIFGNLDKDPNKLGQMDEAERPLRGPTGYVTCVDIYGAISIMALWITCFFKLQITKKVGPFVVYMRYCGKDLSTIATMFVALYIPAFCVFLKTTYTNDSWYEGMFLVLRMVLIDYDYDKGINNKDTPDIWWMFLSMGWIVVSSVIVLNLLIALMADSYSRIYETAELYARIERARFIMEYERTIPSKRMEEFNDRIRMDSPQIVTFDPVCDRDKVSVIEETVEGLTKKFDRLERHIEHKIMKELNHRLDTIDQSLTVYSFR